MAQPIEIGLIDVLNKLDSKIDKLDSKIDALEDKLDSKIDKLDSKIDGLEEKLDSKIEKLETSINNRFNTLTLGFLGLVGVLVTGLLGIVTKIVFFPNL
ncbi:MAG: DUF4164 domain-containing protein [Cyanobacterium sp. T60_A2020_053]|nr:DUF4164 domain-containing protein [Cyanobacterium sp. T60_A2020_053]